MANRRTRRSLQEVTVLIEQGPLHSTLYYWLMRNHDGLLVAAKARLIRWEPLCAKFAALGLTDNQGAVASIRTAQQTWLRVQRAVRQARLLQSTGVHVRRSASKVKVHSVSVQPGIQHQPVQSVSVPATHVHSKPEIGDTKPGVAGPVSREVARARLAAVRRTLDERSGR